MVIIQNVGFYVVLSYATTYFQDPLGFSPTIDALSTTLGLLIGMVFIPPLGPPPIRGDACCPA